MKPKGKKYKTVIRQAMLYGAETCETTRGQEARLEVNEMRMLKWMCGVTMRDKIRNEHIIRTTRVVQAGCEHTRQKKKRAAKPKIERCMQERHDRGGCERRQDNKQGSIEEYDHQLYRRPQMAGQARYENKIH